MRDPDAETGVSKADGPATGEDIGAHPPMIRNRPMLDSEFMARLR